MAFLSDLFDSITNQQATPQSTFLDPAQTAAQGYGIATGLAPQVSALNQAYQPIITGNQLASENQVFGPSANGVQQGAYQSVLNNLNLGNSVPQDLQDLITTNTLQGLGSSGIGTADAGKLFGARSLLSAGLDLGSQRRAEALQASNLLPSSHLNAPILGIPNPDDFTNALYKQQAQKDQAANIAENARRENFSNLINTGGRILGTAAGAYFGAMAGNPIGGAQAGASVGGSLLGHGGVAGFQNNNPANQGGGSDNGFTSILQGLFKKFGSGSANSAGSTPSFGGGGGGIYAA